MGAMRRNFPLFFSFLYYYPLPLSFLRVLRCILLSSWVACHRQSKIKFFPTIFFLSFFLSFFLIGKSNSLSLFLFLTPHLKKTPRQTPRPCLRSARDRSIESRFVTSHREIQTTLLRHRRERERKKWRTFCSHRGCARVRDGTRTGNPSIRPPP